MKEKRNVLILGASYGSLFATKLAMAGHSAQLVCLPDEVDLINSEGAIVKMPIRGREGSIDIRTTDLSGPVSACGPDHARPEEFDLVVLAMQEPQYRSSEIRNLLGRIGETARPCLSIMNMPPLPYLKRIPGLDVDACRDSYTDATAWEGLEPELVTLCSPDPQAFRPPGLPINVLQVRLPTNFKAARFESSEHTAMLRQLESDIQSARFEIDGKPSEVPVKLRVHESIFVPMAKWCMLIAGNYRCIGKDGMRPIREAVRSDPKKSREIYEWVSSLCISLGASKADMVPFDKYAQAADSLITPSSAARALAAGAPNIERVDRLVQTIAANRGLQLTIVDEIVSLVDYWLEQNRASSP
ncbi:MAG: hypothetical protein OXF56_08305 [Rhodobacteraceae bacterium]|nr:hypothetical protein [Paracoccaceae bacterium]